MSINQESSDSIVYTCKKAVRQHNYRESICKWSGAFTEYVKHVQRKHPQCYFVIEKNMEKFRWKLPYLGDQVDIGVFKHDVGFFLYQIVYNASEANLCFAITCIGKPVPEINYVLHLVLRNNNDIKIFTCQPNTKPCERLKMIEKQSCSINLQQSTLQEFILHDRTVEWYIIIRDGKDESVIDPSLFD